MFLFWSVYKTDHHARHFSAGGSYRSGVLVIAGGVADHAVANQAVPRKQKGVAHGGKQHLFGFRKEPFNGNVAEYGSHGFLQRLYHLWSQNKATEKDFPLQEAASLSDQYVKRMASVRYDFLIGISGRHLAL